MTPDHARNKTSTSSDAAKHCRDKLCRSLFFVLFVRDIWGCQASRSPAVKSKCMTRNVIEVIGIFIHWCIFRSPRDHDKKFASCNLLFLTCKAKYSQVGAMIATVLLKWPVTHITLSKISHRVIWTLHPLGPNGPIHLPVTDSCQFNGIGTHVTQSVARVKELGEITGRISRRVRAVAGCLAHGAPLPSRWADL